MRHDSFACTSVMALTCGSYLPLPLEGTQDLLSKLPTERNVTRPPSTWPNCPPCAEKFYGYNTHHACSLLGDSFSNPHRCDSNNISYKVLGSQSLNYRLSNRGFVRNPIHQDRPREFALSQLAPQRTTPSDNLAGPCIHPTHIHQ